MKKKDTVKNQRDFTKLIKSGNKINSNYFVIYYKKNDIEHSRYGISVGTKLGNAVFRNKYKRRIRMLINNNDCLYNNRTDYIILLRKKAIDHNYCELERDLKKLFVKLKEIQ